VSEEIMANSAAGGASDYNTKIIKEFRANQLLEHVTAQPRNPAAELSSGRHRPRAPQFPRPGTRPAQATGLNAQHDRRQP
jgi:hypothetical protein